MTATTDSIDRRLIDALATLRSVEPAELARAEALAEQTDEPIDGILTRLGIASERDVAEAFSRISGAPLVAPGDYPGSAELLASLGARFAENARILPLEDDGGTVRLAMADPLDDVTARLVAMKLSRKILRCTATPTEIETALDRASRKTDSADGDDARARGQAVATDIDLAKLKDMASEAPVVRLVNLMIRRAVEAKASDIHIEPFERHLRVRYRVDGALRDAEMPPAHLRAAIVSRIKIMARLDIAESRLPQDGRIKTVVLGRELDMRVATAPTLHGEGVVIRLLDRSGVTLDFDGLGLDAEAQEALHPLISRPNGILLVTGPTGSGKTTTLYAVLNALNNTERKIVTVEDPVEYQLDGMNQIQVHAGIGLGFAEALRSILRQDPDIIMIGEIRDVETARIAVQAALTGHLVLATLHTNSAAAAFNRLRDMGVPDYLIAATLNGCVAQRLVRKLCVDCARADPDAATIAARIAPGDGPQAFRAPVGCAACSGTGFKGRTTILEVLGLEDRIRDLILEQADVRAIEAAAVAGGMRNLAAHGIARARRGETSLNEVVRVAAAF